MAEPTNKELLDALNAAVKEMRTAIVVSEQRVQNAVEGDRQQLDMMQQAFEPRLKAIEDCLRQIRERFGFLRSVK